MKRLIFSMIILMFVSCGDHWRKAEACNDPVRCGGNNTAYGGAGGQGGAGGAGGAGGIGYGGQGGNGYGGQGGSTGPVTAEGGSVSINSKYEELRQMAVVIGTSVSQALRFKEGAHSDITDSRVMKVDDILDYLKVLEYEECKRGKGSEGDIKIIDGLVRSQYTKTTTVTFHKNKDELDLSQYRFMGFLTGISAINDAAMENAVYGVGEKAMDHGATDVVKVKESATEWGDTSGYAFELGGFITSIIGGAGSRAIGPGGSGAAGYNAMKGGSADRSDVKFAVFVSNARLQEVSQKYDGEKAKAEAERKATEEAKAKEEAERKAKIDVLQKQLDELKK